MFDWQLTITDGLSLQTSSKTTAQTEKLSLEFCAWTSEIYKIWALQVGCYCYRFDELFLTFFVRFQSLWGRFGGKMKKGFLLAGKFSILRNVFFAFTMCLVWASIITDKTRIFFPLWNTFSGGILSFVYWKIPQHIATLWSFSGEKLCKMTNISNTMRDLKIKKWSGVKACTKLQFLCHQFYLNSHRFRRNASVSSSFFNNQFKV